MSNFRRTKPARKPKSATPRRTATHQRFIGEARKLIAADKLEEGHAKLNELTSRWLKTPDPEVLFLHAVIAEKRGRDNEHLRYARQSVNLHHHTDAILSLARALRKKGRTDECCELCDEALAMSPSLTGAPILKAGALEEAGRFDEAEAIVSEALAAAESSGKPPSILLKDVHARILVQRKKHEQAVQVIDDLLEDKAANEGVKRSTLHLRAKSCDRAKQFDEAWDSAVRANEIGEIPFDPDLYTEQVDALMEVWSRDHVSRFPIADCDSELPVFIAGMPRSGTSLIDQIVDAHPKAAGVGELATIESFAAELAMAYNPDKEPPGCFGEFTNYRWTATANRYVEELQNAAESGVERVVNKALGNNRLVGLISRLFPKTRIIHAIRDPRDVAISCFMGGFNNQRNAWTTRVEWASRAWVESARLMEHWKQTLDVPILDVHYEKLVADPENEFPRLIEFLGLPWDDRCFDFYKSKRTVRTLSYDQVNRPIYTTSSGRHKNYEAFIKDIEFPEYILA
ncbi:MAG: sulfotransferase [Planctomycetota bacterium]